MLELITIIAGIVLSVAILSEKRGVPAGLKWACAILGFFFFVGTIAKSGTGMSFPAGATSGQSGAIWGEFSAALVGSWLGWFVFYRIITGKYSRQKTTPSETKAEARQRKCPHCAELIDASLRQCPICAEEIPPEKTLCPSCGRDIKPEAKKCKHCGAWIGLQTNDDNIPGKTLLHPIRGLTDQTALELVEDQISGRLSSQELIMKYGFSPSELVFFSRSAFDQGLIDKPKFIAVMRGHVKCQNCLKFIELASPMCESCRIPNNTCFVDGQDEIVQSEEAKIRAADIQTQLDSIERSELDLRFGFPISACVGFLSYPLLVTPLGLPFLVASEAVVLYLTWRIGAFVGLELPTRVVHSITAALPILWIIPFLALRNNCRSMRESVLVRALGYVNYQNPQQGPQK